MASRVGPGIVVTMRNPIVSRRPSLISGCFLFTGLFYSSRHTHTRHGTNRLAAVSRPPSLLSASRRQPVCCRHAVCHRGVVSPRCCVTARCFVTVVCKLHKQTVVGFFSHDLVISLRVAASSPTNARPSQPVPE